MSLIKLKVLCFGHSYIRRLGEYSSHEGPANLALDVDKFEVTFHGVGGAKITPGKKSLQNELHVLRACSPDIVFLQIGENDLATLLPVDVVKYILSFAEFLSVVYKTSVIVGQLLPRAYDQFNLKVRTVNSHLADRIQRCDSGVSFWKHRGFYKPQQHLLHRDSVHLNSTGQRKFLQSIKYAVLRQVGLQQGQRSRIPLHTQVGRWCSFGDTF